jgi:hypothetical protein
MKLTTTLSSNLKRRFAESARKFVVAGLNLWLVASLQNCPADEPESVPETNKFPSVAEVIGGQTFENDTEQDIYFLRAIHDRYHSHWSDLLEANITLQDFALSPEKLLRFVNELGEAMLDRNDPAACANLALITGDPSFYANTNVNRPEIIQAAARALIKIGLDGRKSLAASITENHYRTDPGSLEDIADVIGEARPEGTEFVGPLTAMAFKFTASNGGSYPHCTTAAVKNLLCLNNGLSAVRQHLKIEEVSNSPGRFQAVMDGIAAAHTSELQANLVVIQKEIQARLTGLAKMPGGYRDDLQELEAKVEQTLANLQNSGTNKLGN